MRIFAYLGGGEGGWSYRDKILHRGRGPRHNHPCKFWWRSVQGFLRERLSNFPLFHWLALSSLKHSGTNVPACDVTRQNLSSSLAYSWVKVQTKSTDRLQSGPVCCFNEDNPRLSAFEHHAEMGASIPYRVHWISPNPNPLNYHGWIIMLGMLWGKSTINSTLWGDRWAESCPADHQQMSQEVSYLCSPGPSLLLSIYSRLNTRLWCSSSSETIVVAVKISNVSKITAI